MIVKIYFNDSELILKDVTETEVKDGFYHILFEEHETVMRYNINEIRSIMESETEIESLSHIAVVQGVVYYDNGRAE